MKNKYPYIVVLFQKALEAGLITENTTRRTNADRTKVILSYMDFQTWKPTIKASYLEEMTQENVTTERYATTLEEKVQLLGGMILTQEQALKEVSKPEWNNIEQEG